MCWHPNFSSTYLLRDCKTLCNLREPLFEALLDTLDISVYPRVPCQVVRTVPGLRHVLDNGTIIFPPFPATELEPTIHQQASSSQYRDTAGQCCPSSACLNIFGAVFRYFLCFVTLSIFSDCWRQEYRCVLTNTEGSILSRVTRVSAGESCSRTVHTKGLSTYYVSSYNKAGSVGMLTNAYLREQGFIQKLMSYENPH